MKNQNSILELLEKIIQGEWNEFWKAVLFNQNISLFELSVLLKADITLV